MNNPIAWYDEYFLNKDGGHPDFNPAGRYIAIDTNPHDYHNLYYISCIHLIKTIKGRKVRMYYEESGFYFERLTGAKSRQRIPTSYKHCDLADNDS